MEAKQASGHDSKGKKKKVMKFCYEILKSGPFTFQLMIDCQSEFILNI